MSSQDDWLVDPKSNRFIDTYLRGYLDMSGGNLTLRNNNINVNDGDISLNGRLLVNSDTSLNSKLFVANDVSMNERLMVGSDVSFNAKMFVANDVSMNERLMVGNDVSFNSKLFAANDVSMNEKLHVGNNVIFDSKLLVQGDTSFNSNVDISGDLVIRGTLGVYQRQEVKVINTTVNDYQLIITEDISLNGNLYVKDDVSMNSKLFVANDVCMNEMLMVGNDVSFNSDLFVGKDTVLNHKLYVGNDVSMDTILTVGGDVSFNQKLYVGNDVSMDNMLFVGNDVSMNQKLYVVGDVSMNTRLTVGGNVSMNELLMVRNDVSFNSNLFVDGDLSLNRQLSVGGDVSMNNKLYVTGDVSMDNAIYIGGNASVNSKMYIRDDVSMDSMLTVNGDTTLNSRLSVNADIVIENGSITSNDISFNVQNLPLSVTGNFTDTNKVIYSKFSNSERVFNGLYDISASSFQETNEQWNAFSTDLSTNWRSSANYEGGVPNDNSPISQDILGEQFLGEYIELELPFYTDLQTITIACDNFDSTNNPGITKFVLLGYINNSWSKLVEYEDNGTGIQSSDVLIDITNKFFTNKIRFVIKNVSTATNYACISKFAFSGNVIGSKLHLDNGNIGIGNVNPRSALEITGNMVLSNAITGVNNSGESQEHGRIDWAGIGRDISNNNHSSYIRSYFEDGTNDTSGNLAFGTSDGVNVADDKYIIHATGQNEFITDVSINSNLVVGGDIRFNSNLNVVGDVSMNTGLIVGGDVSFNSKLNVIGDVSMDTGLFVGGDVSMNSGLTIRGNAVFETTTNFIGDVSVNSELNVNSMTVKDISTNNLTVLDKVVIGSEDTSFNEVLTVIGKIVARDFVISGGEGIELTTSKVGTLKLGSADDDKGPSITTLINDNTSLVIKTDGDNNRLTIDQSGKTTFHNEVSMNSTLFVGNDVSLNSKLYVVGEVELNNKLYVVNDVSMDNALIVGGDVSMNSGLAVGGNAEFNSNVVTFSDVSMNSALIVGGDVSVNSNLYVVGDTYVNGNLSISADVSLNGNANISNKILVNKDGAVIINNKNLVIGDSVYLSSVIAGSIFDSDTTPAVTEFTVFFADASYNILSSSLNSTSGRNAVSSAFVNNQQSWKSARDGYVEVTGLSHYTTNTNSEHNTDYYSTKYATEITNIVGDYIETLLPYPTTIDGVEIHTDTYQVPSEGYLFGEVIDSNNVSKWVELLKFDKTNIVDDSDIKNQQFTETIGIEKQFETTKLRFVITKIKASTNFVIDPDSNDDIHYSNNVAIRYINFSGVVRTTGISIGAGFSQNTANTSMGFATLTSNQDGKNNIALGNYALSQTTSSDSIAIGYNSLIANTSGIQNIGIGSDTLLSNSTGERNVAVGHNSGYSNNRGDYNTFIGNVAGYSNYNGDYNTFLGYNTDISGYFSHSTAIGADSTITDDNQIVIGTALDNIKIPGTIQVNGIFEGDVSFNDDIQIKGSTALNSTLKVSSSTTLDGTLKVTGKTTVTTMEVNNTSIFNNKLTVNTGGVQTNAITVTGNTTLNNTLSVDNATTLNSTLSVNNATTLKSTLHVSEPTTLQSRLDVVGDVSLNENVTVNNLQVTGNIVLDKLNTSGDAIIGGSLTVPNDSINLANKLRIDNNITTIQDDVINILNSGTRTRFIEIIDNKLTITGLNATDEVMDVTGVITASNVTLKAGGTVTSSGDTSTSSSSIVIGDTSNGLGIYPKDGTGTAGDPFSGIKFIPFIDETSQGILDVFSIDNSGNTIIDGTLTVNNGTTIDSSFNVTGYSSLNNLKTTGDTSLNNLNVINASTLSSTLNVNGATVLSSTLYVTGLSTLSNVTVSSNLNVSNATTLLSSLDVNGSSTFNDTLTVSKKTSLNSDVDISGNVSISHGPFTVNDVSFNVTSLPTSITGNFTSNQKTLYSTYSGSDRTFNGLYDVSASSAIDNKEPWNAFSSTSGSGWGPALNSNTNPSSRVSYIDNNSSVVDISCEYIQITFPFYIKLNESIITTSINNGVTLIASDNDDSFYWLATISSGNSLSTSFRSGSDIPIPHTFYSNKFRVIFPAQNNSIEVNQLSFNGDVLGSRIHVDNGNLGIGTTVPRSALEVTGDMVISKPSYGENTSGNSVEHGRIVWAGIGRDVSNNNHSSYIRSYFENDTYDTSGNLAFGTSDGVNVASDKYIIKSTGENHFITDVSMDSNLAVNGDVSFNNNLYVKEKVWIDGTMGIGTSTPTQNIILDINDTGALRIPVGENSTRPIDVTGATSNASYYGSIRYNTQGSNFEGYGPGGTWRTLTGLSNASTVTRIDPDVDNELIFYTAVTGTNDINNSKARMVIKNTPDISMNTSLSVAGNCNFNSDVDISGDLVITGNLSVYQTKDTTTIHTTVNDYTLIVSEDISLNGELKMSGAATLNSTLNVTGATTVSNTLKVTGVATLNNTLNVTGVATLNNTLNVTGATTVSNTLKVTGSTVLGNSLNVTGATTVSNTLKVTGAATFAAVDATSFNASSDYRIKENVISISDTSYNIDKLRPVTYTNTKAEKQDFGVIAHELQQQLPFLVSGEKDGENYQSVNYNGLIGLLLNEVQQLKKRVQELEQSKP